MAIFSGALPTMGLIRFENKIFACTAKETLFKRQIIVFESMIPTPDNSKGLAKWPYRVYKFSLGPPEHQKARLKI